MENKFKGETLSGEEWAAAAEQVKLLSAAVSDLIKDINCKGCGTETAEDFEVRMQLAYIAMRYVGAFAADKCKFILVKED